MADLSQLSDEQLAVYRDLMAQKQGAQGQPTNATVIPGRKQSAWDRAVDAFGEFSSPFHNAPSGEGFEGMAGRVLRSIADIPRQSGQALQDTGSALWRGDIPGAAYHAAGAVPVIGPMAQTVSDDLSKQDYAGAVGHAAGLAASAGLGTRGVPSAKLAGQALRETPWVVAEGLRAAPEAVSDVATTTRAVVPGAVRGGWEAKGRIIPSMISRKGMGAEVAGHLIGGPKGATVAAGIAAATPVVKGMIQGGREAVRDLRLRQQPPAPEFTPDWLTPEQTGVKPRTSTNAEMAQPADLEREGIARSLTGKSYEKLNTFDRARIDDVAAKVRGSESRAAPTPTPQPSAPEATPPSPTPAVPSTSIQAPPATIRRGQSTGKTRPYSIRPADQNNPGGSHDVVDTEGKVVESHDTKAEASKRAGELIQNNYRETGTAPALAERMRTLGASQEAIRNMDPGNRAKLWDLAGKFPGVSSQKRYSPSPSTQASALKLLPDTAAGVNWKQPLHDDLYSEPHKSLAMGLRKMFHDQMLAEPTPQPEPPTPTGPAYAGGGLLPKHERLPSRGPRRVPHRS